MSRCRACATPLREGARFCTSCGAPVAEDRPAAAFGPPAALVAIVALVVAAIAAGVVIWSARGSSEAAPAAHTTSTPLPSPVPAPIRASLNGARASAGCVAPDSRDSAGNPTSYGAAKAVDGDPTTAWRCPGSGTGESLTIVFPAPVLLHRVGLVPGLAKTDPGSGVDRYAQNRRLTAVGISTDTGQEFILSLDPTPSNRAMQWGSMNDVVTSRVTLTILSSTPGSAQDGVPANDTVAISEIEVG